MARAPYSWQLGPQKPLLRPGVKTGKTVFFPPKIDDFRTPPGTPPWTAQNRAEIGCFRREIGHFGGQKGADFGYFSISPREPNFSGQPKYIQAVRSSAKCKKLCFIHLASTLLF